MGFDSPFAQYQDFGYFAIEFSLRNERRYFTFAHRQPAVSLFGYLFGRKSMGMGEHGQRLL